jgi:hypothetical protein
MKAKGKRQKPKGKNAEAGFNHCSGIQDLRCVPTFAF